MDNPFEREWTNEERKEREEFFREPEKIAGKHRFMAGSCVDCGKPLEEVCIPFEDQARNESAKD